MRIQFPKNLGMRINSHAKNGTSHLSDLLAHGMVSEGNTDPETLEYLDLDLLDSDPRNFYELSGVDDLASNIALMGLQQPIRVRTNPDDPNRVIIVSGHRRCAALRQLVAEGNQRFRAVPCIREQREGSEALQELRLIYANSDTRKLTAAEIGRQAERVEMLLYRLKEEGYPFPGRMRDYVAEACQVSRTKLARLRVIRENLIPSLYPLFDENRLTEQAAYVLARFPAEIQEQFSHRLEQLPTGSHLEELLKRYEAGHRWSPDFHCPDGTPCPRGELFLEHDMTHLQEMCGGTTCCRGCERAERCSYACEQAKQKEPRQNRNEAENKAEKTSDNVEKVWHRGAEQPVKSGFYWCITGTAQGGGGLYWWSAKARHWEDSVSKVRRELDVLVWMECPKLPEWVSWSRIETKE